MKPLPPLPIIPNERVRSVPRHRGYAVGSDGSLWSCRGRGRHSDRFRPTWQRLKPTVEDSGYLYVSLRGKRLAVHRVVLLTVRGRCPRGKEARHMDGNPANNRADNLRWGTRKQNQADRLRHGTDTRGERNPNAKLDECSVIYAREMRRGGMSQGAIAKKLGVRLWTVQRILNGEGWAHVA